MSCPGSDDEKSRGVIVLFRTSSWRSSTTSAKADCWSTRTSRAAASYDRNPTSTVTPAATAANDTAKVVRNEASPALRRVTQSSRRT